ncbi:MAG: hypothetical protein WA021_04955 [Minisyncoccia bacterium]
MLGSSWGNSLGRKPFLPMQSPRRARNSEWISPSEEMLEPPFGMHATITPGSIYELPRGLYDGLVGIVPAHENWKAAQLKEWKANNKGNCLVEFHGRGTFMILQRSLRFSMANSRGWQVKRHQY